ncbi:MAG: RidA family protein [Mesorhizobium sp.]|nr:MAG: RidA family protein [Mesorhizobium sp.]
MTTFEARAFQLGIEFPAAPKAVANYVPTYRTGNLLFVSGQLCMGSGGKLLASGLVSVDVSIEDATLAARASAINVLSQIRAALGSLDGIKQIVRLGGFIAAPADFTDHAKTMNGASDLMVEIFGEQGRHTRSTVGVASLPMRAAVEVEAVAEIA